MNMSPRLTSSATVALLCVFAGGAHAEEPGWSHATDLRVFYDQLETDNKIDSNITGNIDGEFDDAWRVGLAAQSAHREHAPIAFSHGGSISYLRWEEDDAVEQRYEAIAVNLHLGIALFANDWFHIEVTALGGVGGARGDIGGDQSEIGLYWEYGAEAGAYFTFGNLQLGIHAGWLHNEFNLDFEEGLLNGLETDIETEGVYIGASVGLRF